MKKLISIFALMLAIISCKPTYVTLKCPCDNSEITYDGDWIWTYKDGIDIAEDYDLLPYDSPLYNTDSLVERVTNILVEGGKWEIVSKAPDYVCTKWRVDDEYKLVCVDSTLGY